MAVLVSRNSHARSSTTVRVQGVARLVVLQVLVLSLFATLLARLWYLQVAGGAGYQAQAAEQSIREIVQQPARGLIVDDMGRPLVANRTSWVVTLDRTMLHKMSEPVQEQLLRRIARAVGQPYSRIKARTLICGEEGSRRGVCWNGSRYQPVPVAEDIRQQTAVSIMEQGEDFPAVIVESRRCQSIMPVYGPLVSGDMLTVPAELPVIWIFSESASEAGLL